MHPSTFDDALRRLCGAKPFVPFAVELANGARLLVQSPEVISTFNGLATYVSDGGRRHYFDGSSVCRLFESPVDPDLEIMLDDRPF